MVQVCCTSLLGVLLRLRVWLTQLQFSRSINAHKCHMIKNVKDNRGEIFAHIHDIDTDLEYYRGAGDELYPRILYPNGDSTKKHLVFRDLSLLNVSHVLVACVSSLTLHLYIVPTDLRIRAWSARGEPCASCQYHCEDLGN